MTWAVMKNQHFAPQMLHTADTLDDAKTWLKELRDKELADAKSYASPMALRWVARRQRIAYRIVELKEAA